MQHYATLVMGYLEIQFYGKSKYIFGLHVAKYIEEKLL